MSKVLRKVLSFEKYYHSKSIIIRKVLSFEMYYHSRQIRQTRIFQYPVLPILN